MAGETTQSKYNDPKGGTASTIGSTQMNNWFYQKQALIEARKEQYFSQLADVTAMPKNMGKSIKRFQYLPLLNDENANDQGLDAAGVVIDATKYYVVLPRAVQLFTVEANATAAVAAINAITGGTPAVKSGSSNPWTVTITPAANAVLDASTGTIHLSAATLAQANAVTAAVTGAVYKQGYGNLYGSSKDVGTISGKLPTLTEVGGRVNRVGFKRKEIEGTIKKYGFFDEYTQESLDFDSDAELWTHINREMVNGANEITEDLLQRDLLNAAGVVKYAGTADATSKVNATYVTYGDLMRLSIALDNNRTPKGTKVITGTRMIDTRTIPASRVMYVGSEMLPTLRAMQDSFSQPAFIPVQKYAAAGDTLTGEVGSIDNFRIVVVPEMMKWAGAGAELGGNTTCYASNGRFDVFPMLVVGSESFTTIGFQTDGKSTKFTIYHKPPGEGSADRNDPYGETGFMSIKWYYGFMALRPERIAVIKTSALI